MVRVWGDLMVMKGHKANLSCLAPRRAKGSGKGLEGS